MALTIKRAGSDEYGRFIKLLLTGDPGSGKTRLSSTFPDTLYANIEGGLMSVVDRQPAYVDITSTLDLDILHAALAQPPKARQQLLKVSVRTVVLDTIDSLQKILISERLKEQHKEAMAMADWGWLGDRMRDIIRGFRNLDMNVIFCCHVRTVEDGETGAVLVKPALQGQMGDEIPAYVDLAVLLRARPENKVVDGQNVRSLARIMQTAPDARHPWLKDRSGRLPMELAVDLTTDFARINELVFSAMSPPSATEATVGVTEAPVTEAPVTEAPVTEAPEVRSDPVAPEEPVAEGPKKTRTRAPSGLVAPQELNGGNGDEAPVEVVAAASGPIEAAAEAAAVAQAIAVVTDAEPEEVCAECGGSIESEDQRDLSRIRFRKPLCRACFATAKIAKAR